MKTKILLLLLLCPLLAGAQQRIAIGYAEYMRRVCDGNLAYAAERLNIPVAEAEIRAAALFNDPSLAVEYAYNDDRRMQMGQGVTVELSKTFSPGKRRARIDLAAGERELAAALLDDRLRTLRAEAATVYLEAAKQRRLYEVAADSYRQIAALATADSLRFALGEITEVDALQSRIEAGVGYNEMVQAQAGMESLCATLAAQFGSVAADTLYIPRGEPEPAAPDYVLHDLLPRALDNRADLVAALRNTDVAQKALRLVRRERNIDFDLSVGYNYNTEVRNEIAPAPKFSGITVGVAVPLKFSNLNKGAVRSAAYRAEQAELQYRQAQVEVQTEVVQAYNAYRAACRQVERFDDAMIEEAKRVLEGKIYSYNRGESSLLEVLDARRTYNDVQTRYIETLYDRAQARVALEASVGI